MRVEKKSSPKPVYNSSFTLTGKSAKFEMKNLRIHFGENGCSADAAELKACAGDKKWGGGLMVLGQVTISLYQIFLRSTVYFTEKCRFSHLKT